MVVIFLLFRGKKSVQVQYRYFSKYFQCIFDWTRTENSQVHKTTSVSSGLPILIHWRMRKRLFFSSRDSFPEDCCEHHYLPPELCRWHFKLRARLSHFWQSLSWSPLCLLPASQHTSGGLPGDSHHRGSCVLWPRAEPAPWAVRTLSCVALLFMVRWMRIHVSAEEKASDSRRTHCVS